MKNPPDYRPLGCAECRHGAGLDFDFSMAFQPIVDAERRNIFAHEALVRGVQGQSAGSVFANVNRGDLYRFDQSCRVKAITLAAQLGMQSRLSINFMPNAVYKPELCIRTTLNAAYENNFPVERIIFEATEGERITDQSHLQRIVTYYRQQGFATAIDDFGAGYAGLGQLADFQPDIIKLDMALIRDIDTDPTRQAIVRGIVQMCRDLGIRIIAEGIETRGEYHVVRDFGVSLFQGYYFARPAFESLVEVPDSAFD